MTPVEFKLALKSIFTILAVVLYLGTVFFNDALNRKGIVFATTIWILMLVILWAV